MRVGQNPAKSIDQVPQPARLTIAVVVYIPFLSGYYAESLQVLKTCLGSIWENTPAPYDLLVFDNASCPEVRDYLRQEQAEGRIQFLVLSDKNIGKGGAWNFIFQGAPGEIVAYCDSDVYFYPGWLEATLKILQGFPKVGMVSSRPLRTPEAYFTSTLEWARDTAGVEVINGHLMSWEIYKEHTDSLGVTVEQAREWFETTSDWQVRYDGLEATIGAAHFQFVATKQTLQALAPLKMDRPMGQVRSLDEQLNRLGYLRLSTNQRYVKHLGNTLRMYSDVLGCTHPTIRMDSVPNQGNAKPLSHTQTVLRHSGSSLARKLANLPFARRALLWVYDQIFRLYFNKSI